VLQNVAVWRRLQRGRMPRATVSQPTALPAGRAAASGTGAGIIRRRRHSSCRARKRWRWRRSSGLPATAAAATAAAATAAAGGTGAGIVHRRRSTSAGAGRAFLLGGAAGTVVEGCRVVESGLCTLNRAVTRGATPAQAAAPAAVVRIDVGVGPPGPPLPASPNAAGRLRSG
jgi:hypothetical protein